MNACYEEYATTMEDKLLERAGRYQEQLEARNFFMILKLRLVE